MLSRTLASPFFLAAALVLSAGSGCNKNGKLTEVEVPEAGMSLRYDLTPGQEYSGEVTMRTAAQTPMGDMTSTVKFNVALVVSAKSEDGAQLVRATVSGIEANARMPAGIPAAAAGINPEAAAALNGMELRFNINPRGKVSNTPEPPESAPPEIKAMIGLITSGLEGGLSLRLPEESLKAGATWDSTSEEQDEDVKSAKGTGSLERFARNEAGEDVATLAYVGESQSERTQGENTMQVNQKVETNAEFSASGGYPISIKRKINNEIVGQVTFIIELDAEWSKGALQEVAPAAPTSAPANDGTEVQDVNDPCDPDYVGMGVCEADEAELAAEEAAAEGKAAEAAGDEG